jgi:choline dehydrogenase-like flavoprotein
MDIDARPTALFERWPFAYADLEPFYRRAQGLCGLGPFIYDGEYWSNRQSPCLSLDAGGLTTRVYQCGVGRLFTDTYPDDLRRSANVTLCHHATVCRLHPRGDQTIEASAVELAGGRFVVRARTVVLAAGAIENARLLLLSDLGNRRDWVGRCFMEHPRDHALLLVPRTPQLVAEMGFYDLHRARDGITVAGRIALSQRIVQSQQAPNTSITLRPRRADWPSTIGLKARLMSHVRRGVTGRRPDMSYGWSSAPDGLTVSDGFHVLLNLEQRPHPENRVVLSRDRDRFGVPRGELRWRWRREDQAALGRARTFVASALEAAGLGRVHVRGQLRPDPNAHHHAGTTRMHVDPRYGVVDADGRVHGTDNVYVTGASVLPTAGFANPTLTIVALAVRLADHLKKRM